MEETVQPLLILGTRTLAVEVADLVSETHGFRLAGFVENWEPARCRETLEGLPIVWVDELKNFADTHVAICALATTHRSLFTKQAAELGMKFATVVHPTARISMKSTLGAGTIVSVGVIVAAHTNIGQHVFINRGALIGHHTEIGDHVSIMPGANIAGACRIGEAVYIGMGAIIRENIAIGAHSVVGAGAVVTKDVPPNVQVIGMPARIVKENVSGR